MHLSPLRTTPTTAPVLSWATRGPRAARAALAALPSPRAELRRTVRWATQHGLAAAVLRRAAADGDLQGLMVTRTAGSLEAPYEIARDIRESAPLHRSRYAWTTADHAVVREVLAHPDLRSGFPEPERGPVARLAAWAGEPDRLGPLTPPSLLVTDGADHTRYRRLVTRVFSARAVEALRARTQEVAAQLAADLPRHVDARGEVDLVEAYCAPLPVTVICEILGVPAEERERVLAFGQAAAPSLDLGLSWAQMRRVEVALDDFRTWLVGHLEHLREHPGDDLMSRLVAARDEETGEGLSQDELLATAGLVLAAGFETTVNLLSNGLVLLTGHPAARAALAADPDLWGNAVDEVLRFDPPVLLTGRAAATATEVAGQQVRAGEMISAVLAGANRDPAVFTDPDTFDVTSANARDHVSFSGGRHYCLGAALARMEGEVGLRTLLETHPDLVLSSDRRRRPTRILRGWATLPARL
ncbi:cytochrome P450 [Nocardioides bruguierae]|uniref:cytochrome P450 n=1 Tax=Nocardioides bruguierae TaxID=2945102 RepID=UPI002020483F|nr:cytochrome P450 [Nocardioides bruguierae]MCL8025411.1 cytochrome P450 [Nocardioides bruguierae]